MSLKFSLRFALVSISLMLFHLSLVLSGRDIWNSKCDERGICNKATLKFPFELQKLYSSSKKKLIISINDNEARLAREDNGGVESYRFYRGNLKLENSDKREINFQVSNAESKNSLCELHVMIYTNAVDFVSLEYKGPCNKLEFEVIRPLPALPLDQPVGTADLAVYRAALLTENKRMKEFESAHPFVKRRSVSFEDRRKLSSFELQFLKLEERQIQAQHAYDALHEFEKDVHRQASDFQSFVNQVKKEPQVHIITLTYQVHHLSKAAQSRAAQFPGLVNALHARLNAYFAENQVFPGIQLRFERQKSSEQHPLDSVAHRLGYLPSLELHNVLESRLGQMPKGHGAMPVHLHLWLTPEPLKGTSRHVHGITRPASPLLHLFEKPAVVFLSTHAFKPIRNSDAYIHGLTMVFVHQILHTLGAVHVDKAGYIMFLDTYAAVRQTKQQLPISDFTKLIVLAAYQEKREECTPDNPSELCKKPDIYAWLSSQTVQEKNWSQVRHLCGRIQDSLRTCIGRPPQQQYSL